MTDTKISQKPRGRPRAFETEAALATAQQLFHDRGYDNVSVAQLTQALGINPPSFYAAFGSKAGLLDQVLARYAASALPLGDILQDGRDVAEALAEILLAAARAYSQDPAQAGCLVIETARSQPVGDDRCAAARRIRDQARLRIRDFVAQAGVSSADQLADFVDATLSGLSDGARKGWSHARLRGVAEMAGQAITATVRSA